MVSIVITFSSPGLYSFDIYEIIIRIWNVFLDKKVNLGETVGGLHCDHLSALIFESGIV